MKPKYCMIVLAVVSVGSLGCEKSNEANLDALSATNVTAREVKQEVREALTATRDYVSANKDQFVAATEEKLKQLDSKIAELGVKAQSLQADAKVEGTRAVDALKEQRVKLGEKLEEVKKASQETWQDVKAGFDTAMNELEKTYENLKAKFNG
jgi:ribosome-associated translation inhibitor RaiA